MANSSSESLRAPERTQVQLRVGSAVLRAGEQNALALYSTRLSLLRIQADRVAQSVNRHLALGRGFESAMTTAAR